MLKLAIGWSQLITLLQNPNFIDDSRYRNGADHPDVYFAILHLCVVNNDLVTLTIN